MCMLSEWSLVQLDFLCCAQHATSFREHSMSKNMIVLRFKKKKKERKQRHHSFYKITKAKAHPLGRDPFIWNTSFPFSIFLHYLPLPLPFFVFVSLSLSREAKPPIVESLVTKHS